METKHSLIATELQGNESNKTVFSIKNWAIQCADSNCSDLYELIKSCLSLTQWEKEFLSDIIFRRPLAGSRIYLTEKQKTIYDRIYKNKLNTTQH